VSDERRKWRGRQYSHKSQVPVVLQLQAFVEKGIGFERMIGQIPESRLTVAKATELREVEVNVEERSQAMKYAG
jgi:hypothetical protein